MSANPIKSLNREAAKVMSRTDIVRRLVARLNKDEAVIGGIGNTNFELWASGQRAQNFYMLGSMGLTVPIALGVALAQPTRQVFALEGDGSLLMQLGVLSSVAAAGLKNLAVIFLDNGIYQITGGQPTLTASGTDVVAIAKGSGLSQSTWTSDEAHFEALVDRALDGQGPCFIGVRTDDKPPAGITNRDAARIRGRFMRGLGITI